MGRDPLRSSSGQDVAEEPRERGDSPSRESIFVRLAQPARIAVVAALSLGLGILTIDGSNHAPLSALVAPAAAPAVAAPEARLAYVEVASPIPPASTPDPAPVSTTLRVEASLVAAEAAEPMAVVAVADEPVTGGPVADQDELLRELRPQLSARGDHRAVEAQPEAELLAEQAVQGPSKQEMTTSIGLQAAPNTPAPTKAPTQAPRQAPTKTPTPKPAPTKAPTKAPTPLPVATTAPVVSGSLGQQVVSIALRYVGYRYASGGVSPSTGFDCSGFTYFVYKTAGHPISRDIFVQYRTGEAVSRSSLMPGDLVFFQNTYRSGLSHASIYIGGGRIVHAQSESTGVTTSSLSTTYWSSHYLGARRP